MADHLVPPYGGALVDVVVDDERAFELRKASTYWPSWDLTPRHLCDLELLLSGAFSPLRGFLGSADVASVWPNRTPSPTSAARAPPSPCATPRG